MPDRSPTRGADRLRLPFTAALALSTLACGPSSATSGAPGKANVEPAPTQPEPPPPLASEPSPAPERLPTPTCDAASAPLHALRQAAAGTIAAPGDIDKLAAFLRAIDDDLGGERGHALAAELSAAAKAAADAGSDAKPPSVDALARLDALIALWFRDQLRRAVEVKVEAERNLAWSRAECSWGLLAADPDLMTGLEEERLGEIVAERLLAGRAILLAEGEAREGWDRIVLPARQAIEKRLFTVAQRTLLREASVAKADNSSDAAARASAAFLLLRDRLQDKNSPAIAPIEAMLAGPPAAIDLHLLTDALAITFAKRSRKYCSEVVSSPELVGEAAGLSSVTEGMTYSRLILPDMSARLGDAGFSADAYLGSWDALLEEVDSGQDAGEIRRLSDELVRWNCAYQEALGIAECTWNRDEVAKP